MKVFLYMKNWLNWIETIYGIGVKNMNSAARLELMRDAGTLECIVVVGQKNSCRF